MTESLLYERLINTGADPAEKDFLLIINIRTSAAVQYKAMAVP